MPSARTMKLRVASFRPALLLAAVLLSMLTPGPGKTRVVGVRVPMILSVEGVDAAATLRGGFMNFQLSPHCMRALVAVTIACSQVGPAGLAGCGVVLHQASGACP